MTEQWQQRSCETNTRASPEIEHLIGQINFCEWDKNQWSDNEVNMKSLCRNNICSLTFTRKVCFPPLIMLHSETWKIFVSVPPPLAKATQTAQRISGKTLCAESDGRVHSAGIVQESLLFWGSGVFSSKTCSLFRRTADVSVSECAFL